MKEAKRRQTELRMFVKMKESRELIEVVEMKNSMMLPEAELKKMGMLEIKTDLRRWKKNCEDEVEKWGDVEENVGEEKHSESEVFEKMRKEKTSWKKDRETK
jgi:hypothetical protein